MKVFLIKWAKIFIYPIFTTYVMVTFVEWEIVNSLCNGEGWQIRLSLLIWGAISFIVTGVKIEKESIPETPKQIYSGKFPTIPRRK